MVFEAMNHAGGLKKNLIVILNDNKMSICPRVGGLAESLDRLRMAQFYTGLKVEVQKLLNRVPVIGDPVERFLTQIKDAVKAGLVGGMIFEDLGFRYIGPVDGHNIRQLQKYLAAGQGGPRAGATARGDGEGARLRPAEEDPTTFHAPAPFDADNGSIVGPEEIIRPPALHATGPRRGAGRDARGPEGRGDHGGHVPGQHARAGPRRVPRPVLRRRHLRVARGGLAAGLAKAGLRPVVDIYSTFLQRSYDQLFQEVSLQNLPVTLLLDRSGLVGPDGPTHHGMFDLAYLAAAAEPRGDGAGRRADVAPMIDWALEHAAGGDPLPEGRGRGDRRERPSRSSWARRKTIRHGRRRHFVACGTMVRPASRPPSGWRPTGVDVGVINARFVKPLDTRDDPGRGCASAAGGDGRRGRADGRVRRRGARSGRRRRTRYQPHPRLGIPDRFIEHGDRGELLADLGLDAAGIARCCREWLGRGAGVPAAVSRVRA